MLDIKKVHEQYEKYVEDDKMYVFFKCKLDELFKAHKQDIIKEKQEYFSLDYATPAPSEYLKTHSILKSYFEYKKEKKYYELKKGKDKKMAYSINENEKIVLVKSSNNSANYFFDLQSEEKILCNQLPEREVSFIISVLEESDSYMGDVTESDIPLMQNIIYDTKLKNKNGVTTNNEVLNEFKKVKGNSCLGKNHKERKLQLTEVSDLRKQNENLLLQNAISLDDYVVNLYIYHMLEGEDIEKMYLCANECDKKLILKAYQLVSSYQNNQLYTRRIRVKSEVINHEIYSENKKNAKLSK